MGTSWSLAALSVVGQRSNSMQRSKKVDHQVGFELGDHGQHVAQQPTDRVSRVIQHPTEAELDLTGGELVGDRPGIR